MTTKPEQIGTEIVGAVRDLLQRTLAPLAARLKAVEDRPPAAGEKGERGDPGEPGEKGETGETGQRGEPVHIPQHLLRGALEEPPAAAKEQRVSTEQQRPVTGLSVGNDTALLVVDDTLRRSFGLTVNVHWQTIRWSNQEGDVSLRVTWSVHDLRRCRNTTWLAP